MCVPLCQKKIEETMLNRRSFMKTVGAVTAVAAAASAGRVAAASTPAAPQHISFSNVVDLTHTLHPDFQTYGGEKQLDVKKLFSLKKDGYNLNGYNLSNEHVGTHMDAPIHFSDKDSADAIPAQNLVGELVVVNIVDKTLKNSDAELTVEDLKAWERKWGRISDGAVVAMFSGWEKYVNYPQFRNADAKGVMHFPGFHIDAINYLLEMRSVKGIMVDTLSLDYGKSADFAVHYKWLPANKWGIECAANLGKLPARGATVVVGGPKIAGATGGPSRVLALV
ncbi:MAG: cyclase family protein [Anaerolineae bacterium]|nr:cyclase family protein [Anaerolineae bacterium]